LYPPKQSDERCPIAGSFYLYYNVHILNAMTAVCKKYLFHLYIKIHRLFSFLGVIPFDKNFGLSRGNPVGRYYIEKFLRENSQFVTGRCLEFGDDRYKSYFPQAEKYEVVSITPAPNVTFVCDIHDPSNIPLESFDSIICTQVFEHLAYPEKAAIALFKLLSAGGVLLLTAPFINNVHYGPTDFRRFTPDGIQLILEDAGFKIEHLDYGGNATVATGSLLGMVQEDFTKEELEIKDPIYPYNILVRARRP